MILTFGSELYGQYLLCKSDPPVPFAWQRAQLAGWMLAAHRLLPITEIHDPDSRHVGWLIGHATAKGGALRGIWKLAGKPADSGLFEDQLYQFGGRWVCVLLAPQSRRLYLDPSGSLATVFRADHQAVGSTPSLLRRETAEEYRERKSREPRIKANHFWPAGLTGDPDTTRLLPNHYLDLETWQPVRHWPREPIAHVAESCAIEQVQIIIDRTRASVESLAADRPLYMGLTAGRDSRMVLGCARTVIDRITFATFQYKDPAKYADLHIAMRLAHQLGLKHRTLALSDPPAAQKLEYLFRTGYCTNAGKTCDFFDACGNQLELDRGWLTGFGGEVGRAYYWRKEEASPQRSAGDLLARMHLDATDPNLSAMHRWLEGVPEWIEPYSLLDLMYLELRVGCWASPQQYGTAPFEASIMPFSHRDTYTAMFALPIEYRRNQRLAHDVVRLTWPEALALPFQQYSGWQSGMHRLAERFNGLRKRIARRLARRASSDR